MRLIVSEFLGGGEVKWRERAQLLPRPWRTVYRVTLVDQNHSPAHASPISRMVGMGIF
jgi:hypothetical protein